MINQPAPPIRICRVIARMNVGGPAMHIILLTTHLSAQRFAQLLVTGVEGAHEKSMLPEARARHIETVVIGELGRELSAAGDAVSLWRLYRLLRQWRPDIVETHTAKAGTIGRLAAWLAGVPVRLHVFHGHVFHGYFSPAKTRLFLMIERLLAGVTTRIVALGDVQRDELLGLGIGQPGQVLSVPLGMDLAPFMATDPGQATLRQELGLVPGEDGRAAPLVGIIGRLVPIKAHEVFLAAAASVLAAVPDAHFVIIGDGDRRSALETQAAAGPLRGRVHFLGWRSDLPALYAALDVVALTSDNEGMPTVIIEAMAAGVPVVATDVGGVRTLVADGKTGILCTPRDPGAIAASCVRLLNDPTLRARMGEASRRAVYPRYDISTLTETMAALYGALVAEGGVRQRRR